MKKQSKGFSLDGMSNYYDLITFTENSRFRRKQIELMDIQEGEKILEVGCGTGTLLLLSKMVVGESGEVEGTDIAPGMITKANQKAENAKLKINFKVASVNKLPHPDNTFDLVISSLMFHHLPVTLKREGMIEIYRVLKKGGRFFLCDFGSPNLLTVLLMGPLFIWMSSTRFHLLGRLPALLRTARFKTVELIKKGVFLDYYIMRK